VQRGTRVSLFACFAIVAFAIACGAAAASESTAVPLSKLSGCFSGPVRAQPGCADSTTRDVSLLLDERQTGGGSTEVPVIGLSTFALPCVGTHQVGSHREPDYLQLKKEISIRAKTDAFSYRGMVYNPWEGSGVKTRIVLSGRFTSTTVARMTLTVGYGACGTEHFVLHRGDKPKLLLYSGTISYTRSFSTTVQDGCQSGGVESPETVTDAESWRITFSKAVGFPVGTSPAGSGATGPLTGSFQAGSSCGSSPGPAGIESLSTPGTVNVALADTSDGRIKVYTSTSSTQGLGGTLTFGSSEPEPVNDYPLISDQDGGVSPVAVARAGTTRLQAAVPWEFLVNMPATDPLATEPGTLSVTLKATGPFFLP
jgi:hypothetical protein